jgi:hypothetical protein
LLRMAESIVGPLAIIIAKKIGKNITVIGIRSAAISMPPSMLFICEYYTPTKPISQVLEFVGLPFLWYVRREA